jgi:hypothetical protein
MPTTTAETADPTTSTPKKITYSRAFVVITTTARPAIFLASHVALRLQGFLIKSNCYNLTK